MQLFAPKTRSLHFHSFFLLSGIRFTFGKKADDMRLWLVCMWATFSYEFHWKNAIFLFCSQKPRFYVMWCQKCSIKFSRLYQYLECSALIRISYFYSSFFHIVKSSWINICYKWLSYIITNRKKRDSNSYKKNELNKTKQ